MVYATFLSLESIDTVPDEFKTSSQWIIEAVIRR